MRKTSTAIIVCDKKILFLKRDNMPTIVEPDRWQLPGGHIENGENPIRALKRELVEEVSYVPKRINYIGSLKNRTRKVNIFWSYVDAKEYKKFKLGEPEGQEIKFMTIKQALSKKLTKNVRFYLSSYGSILKRHIANKTIPKIEELKKNTSLLKLLYFKLTQ